MLMYKCFSKERLLLHFPVFVSPQSFPPNDSETVQPSLGSDSVTREIYEVNVEALSNVRFIPCQDIIGKRKANQWR